MRRVYIARSLINILINIRNSWNLIYLWKGRSFIWIISLLLWCIWHWAKCEFILIFVLNDWAWYANCWSNFILLKICYFEFTWNFSLSGSLRTYFIFIWDIQKLSIIFRFLILKIFLNIWLYIFSCSTFGIVNLKIDEFHLLFKFLFINLFHNFHLFNFRISVLHRHIIFMRILINNLRRTHKILLLILFCFHFSLITLFSFLNLQQNLRVRRIPKVNLLSICVPRVFQFFISAFPLIE